MYYNWRAGMFARLTRNGDRMDRPQWRVESARIRNGGMRTWCPRCRLWFSAYYYYHLVHARFCKEEIHD